MMTQIELYLEVSDEHSEKTADMNKASWEKLKIWKIIIGKSRNQVGQTERNGIFFRQRNGNGLVKWTPFIGESGKQ